MNKINPKKLHNSKWTALNPTNKEKHYLVTEVMVDEDGTVVSCDVEAIMTKRSITLPWRELKDTSRWITGWK